MRNHIAIAGMFIMKEDGIRKEITEEATAKKEELLALSHKLHANPEESLQEEQASTWLSEYLKENGFSVVRGIAGLKTSFTASYGTGQPKIAFVAEYDALAGLGHACGHNIIATAAVGAALAAKKAVDAYGGSIVVMGTPDEEGGAGKAFMIDDGAFTDVSAAIMVHPADYNAAIIETLACQNIEVEFFGREAHAAAHPEQGINALEALLLSYASINSLRQHIPERARIHGIITDGGRAPNIVPGHSAGVFTVRSDNEEYFAELKEKVLHCFQGAAAATGARLQYQWDKYHYAAMMSNQSLAKHFQFNMQSLGREMPLTNPLSTFFSTDMANVSLILPAIHAMVAITTPGISLHTPEFAQAAISSEADHTIIEAAKALALTAFDLLSNPENMEEVSREFNSAKADNP